MSQENEQQPQVQQPVSAAIEAKFNHGMTLHQQRNLSDAERIYREVLREQPNHFGALHLLGVIALQTRQPEQGADLIRKAIGLNANVAAAHCNLGKALLDLKRPEEALASFDRAIALEPDFAMAHNNRGKALLNLRRPLDALASYDKVIALNPNFAEAFYNRGITLNAVKRLAEALASYDQAIALKPDYAVAHNDRGNALNDLKRHEEALASYEKAISLKPEFAELHNNRGNALNHLRRIDEAVESYNKAIALKPDFPEAHSNRGNALTHLRRFEEALASYAKAIALKPDYATAYNNRGAALIQLKRHEEALASCDKAIALKPDFAEAYNNRGNALNDLKCHEEALASYDTAIALKPDYAEAHSNRGDALNHLKCHEEALASCNRAITLKPNFAEAYNNRGIALNAVKRHEEALASYNKVIALKPNTEFLYGFWLQEKMMICEWSNLKSEVAQLVVEIERAKKVSSPSQLLSATNSPELQRLAAKIWVVAKHPLNKALPKILNHSRRDKIRIGYFSADFHAHATTYLMAELFESHDRSRFEVIAFSFGPDKNDEMRKRLSAAFDTFIDVCNQSDRDVAMRARKLEIDIAVDLKGFTGGSRTGIFAFRAAPLQVSYLGYPGTMGADYIDYLIADPTLIPASNQKYFSEKIVYLPNSYQANDRKRRIAEKTFTRAEVGLLEDVFVFCCFNNNYKITPDVFDRWMRILKQVEGSVLWLFEDNASAASNLRKEAAARGVNPERLVFAKPMSLPDHLARHRLGDLFLDTLPCNAHTTASDALWAGLPVLTQIGETFAGRVAASLLNAIGMPELITSTPQAYEDLAIELATNPEKLAAIKHKLANNRLTTPLFDTKLFTKHIEAAYTAMYERYQPDLPADHIYVPQ